MICFLVILGVLWAVGSLVQVDCFSYYGKTYNRLVNGTVVLDYSFGRQYYFCNPSDKGKYSSDIVVFTNPDGTLKDVKVGPWKYIHGGLLSYMSPYTLYWLFKYKNWFEENKAEFDSIE